ncbi:MAG TPA: secondary thiamine-phosphate synthase enzyme YjbQ [Spirochaetota bacterium]|nr:secondary thiamine-phosphate synthase enzyme YjbQ [Spirochaetota bacterium]HPI88952.1 secondary thiamine-phosphate synthase enzyme YjbQ [Spirochaetota bacterium]HPR46571.1 secondary thiamine-phosphate synthase enzyme YjbQ [Spirochaetota bacterium]
MTVTDYISLSSNGRRDVIDITAAVQGVISKNSIEQGIAVVFVPGSTAALTTIEYEPGLIKDIKVLLERLIPYKENYRHHETWHDDNGAAHLQAALIGPSITVPVVKGKLTLGTWQQIILIDCDTRPRERKLVVQLIS